MDSKKSDLTIHNNFKLEYSCILHRWPYDLDSYDDQFAEYIAIHDPLSNTQLASLRLLRTDRSHILSSIFPDLCRYDVPCGSSIREITQIYLSPSLLGRRRRIVANQLASALIQYALLIGIESFTTVIETVWSGFLQKMGWQYKTLGDAQTIGGIQLGAFQIHVSSNIVDALRASNCFVECDMRIIEPNPRCTLCSEETHRRGSPHFTLGAF